MTICDLHVHTTASDGTATPAEVVGACRRLGIRYLAVADHDTLVGSMIAVEAAAGEPVVIPAVEVSVDHDGTDLHLLGYGIEFGHPGLNAMLEENGRRRLERAATMLQHMRSAGLGIELEDVLAVSGPAPVSRAHIASALIEKGLSNRAEALGRYLHVDSPCYEKKGSVSLRHAIEVVLTAGGLPVLAHPASRKGHEDIDELLEIGLAGIEVYHPSHDDAETLRLLRFAGERGILVTGGSDCHGPGSVRGSALGTFPVPESCALALLARLEGLAAG